MLGHADSRSVRAAFAQVPCPNIPAVPPPTVFHPYSTTSIVRGGSGSLEALLLHLNRPALVMTGNPWAR